VSELHNRLEQLVNYSSQLIFVGSDSVANQQRNLSDFLALQHESTEVSYLTASDDQSASDYRRIICRQLGNHTVGSFVRPLNELLHDIDADKGNYLVCISQAQHMDMAFLSELWDWVATCRQHQESLHINVILFAEQAWTESAQTALPAYNSNKPVLLSTQSIDAVGFDVNALENLMAHKRAFFAPDGGESIVGKTWFIASVLGVFFFIFVALIAIQYPQYVGSFLSTGTLPEVSQNGSTDAQTQSEVVIEEASESLSSGDYESMLELVEPSITDELLVSSWESDTAQPSIEQPIIEDLPPNESVVEDGSQASTNNAIAQTEQSIQTQSADSEQAGLPDPSELDFAVEDIVSVEQLNAQLEQNISEPLNPSLFDENENARPYEFDEALILNLPETAILLQLSGMQNLSVLRTYLTDNDIEDSTWIYQTQRYGGPWYVVLLGESFSSIAESNLAAQSLSTGVQQSNPFAKTARQVQQEITQL
jgi:DamX protein